MANGVIAAQDPFGLGRLAQSIRQNRQEKRQSILDQQNAITQGLQQQLLGGQVQQQQQGLADIALQNKEKAELTDFLGQNQGGSRTLNTINFYKSRNPEKAQEIITKTLTNAGHMAKFNSKGALDYVNTELGTDWTIDAEDKETLTVDQGDKKVLINKATGDVIKEFPVTQKPSTASTQLKEGIDATGNKVFFNFDPNNPVIPEGIKPVSEKDTQKPTTLIQNLEAAGLKQGTPAFQQAVLSNIQKTGTTQTIEVGPDGSFKIIESSGLPEQKFKAKQEEAKKADEQRAENAIGQAETVINKVDQVLENVGLMTSGVGSLFSIIPGTPAKDIAANIETLKANLAFNALQAMREASKTGGALGAVSERELSLLESQIASLDPKQSPEQLRTNLQEVRKSFVGMLDKAKKPAQNQNIDNTTKVFNFDSQGNLIQ